MRLHPHEFIRRFLLHVLPKGFHRIRHYGFFASPKRAGVIKRLRELIATDDGTAQPSRNVGAGDKATDPEPSTTQAPSTLCPCCGGRASSRLSPEAFGRRPPACCPASAPAPRPASETLHRTGRSSDKRTTQVPVLPAHKMRASQSGLRDSRLSENQRNWYLLSQP